MSPPLSQRPPQWKEAPPILARLFPEATRLRRVACEVDAPTAQSTLRVHATPTTAPCPLCTTPAQRSHSHSERTLADLAWAPYRVGCRLRVRKWFCRQPPCRRRLFTERLPTGAAPWARRTLRLAQRLIALGVALGGKAGVRLGHAWDVAMSRNTLLRRLRRLPAPSLPPRGAGGGRFCPAEAADLWHDPGGSGASAARGSAAGSPGQARGAVAAGAAGGEVIARDRSHA